MMHQYDQSGERSPRAGATREAPPPAAARSATGAARPLLLVDVDGVLSLFGFDTTDPPPGSFHAFEGIPHFISAHAGEQLRALAEHFELVWASGWEERAEEHLPALLGLPAGIPYLRFARDSTPGASLRAHWKLDAIDAYAGARALAWVDDAFNEACVGWAAQRAAPTLLVATEPAVGLTAAHAADLLHWAGEFSR